MSEKRRDLRVNATKEVWLEGQEKVRLGKTRNLSKGGMFVVADGETPDVGEHLEIRVDDAEEGLITLKMEVMWRESSGQGGAGLGLRALTSNDLAAFERVVHRHIDDGDALVPEMPAPVIREMGSDDAHD